MGRIIVIANQKGGVGKTTTAINLSAYIAIKKKRVLLIDMDPQGNASGGFDIDPSSVTKTVYDVMLGEASIEDAIISNVRPKLSIVPSDVNLAAAEINAMCAADSVIVPLQCEYYALEGLAQLMQTVSLIQERENDRLRIEGIVFTMYDGRTNLATQVVENVTQNTDKKIYKCIIPRNVRLAEAPSYGMPITEYDPKSSGAKAYEKLASKVIHYRRT